MVLKCRVLKPSLVVGMIVISVLIPLCSGWSISGGSRATLAHRNQARPRACKPLTSRAMATETSQNTEVAPLSSTTVSAPTGTTVPTSTPQTRSEMSLKFPFNTESDSVSLSLDNLFQNQQDLLLKILNAAVLLAVFGFTSNAMLNIDADITRGWTQPEIAVRIPMDNWATYEHFLHQSPVITKTCINVVIYLLGDWLSQTVFQNKDLLDFDLTRTLRNGFIGMCFGPLVHAYYEWSDAILPVEEGLRNRGLKILMDQTLYLSTKCTIYIIAVGLLAGEPWQDVKEKAKSKIGPICITAWKFWPLVHCITYSLIPARHRILWVNIVDLFWNAILATMAGEKENHDEENIQTSPEEPLPQLKRHEEVQILEQVFVEQVEEVCYGHNTTVVVHA